MAAPLLYDADCGFCRWSAAWILRWDRRRRLRPVALQDPEAKALLAGMGEPQRMASWHLVLPDGEIRSGGAALAPLLRTLPGGGPLAGLAEAMPRFTERAYRLVADHRTRLGPLVPSSAKARADRLIERRSGG
jgi:predicted DCC family thiol-disulfide oxidoreductase YuxK